MLQLKKARKITGKAASNVFAIINAMPDKTTSEYSRLRSLGDELRKLSQGQDSFTFIQDLADAPPVDLEELFAPLQQDSTPLPDMDCL